jgi:ligand-binding SRPBCC domain-containing protein
LKISLKTYQLERTVWVPRPIDEVFAFFADARNLEQLTPPWLRFETLTPSPIEMRPGTLIRYRIRWHFVAIGWLTEIVEWQPPVRFVDVQQRGPYALWHHTHEFATEGDGTRIRDTVQYALPLGVLGVAAHAIAVRRDLARIFDYREQRVAEIFGGPNAKK